MSAYGHQCHKCKHLVTSHLWDFKQGGTLEDGPYRCWCGCERPQHAPMLPLNQLEAQALLKAEPQHVKDRRWKPTWGHYNAKAIPAPKPEAHERGSGTSSTGASPFDDGRGSPASCMCVTAETKRTPHWGWSR